MFIFLCDLIIQLILLFLVCMLLHLQFDQFNGLRDILLLLSELFQFFIDDFVLILTA